jgi:polysaccharide export outer membrane protein
MLLWLGGQSRSQLRADDANERASASSHPDVSQSKHERQQGTQKIAPEDASDRRIAPSDIIVVEVYGEKDLSGEHRVQATGVIKYPYLGMVEVAGKTPSEVADLLQAKLAADYLVDPQVNVMVKEYRSRTVSVIGRVNREGAIDLPAEQRIDIVEAIARAMGFHQLANKNKISLTRSGKTSVYKFDDLRKITDPEKKIWLEPGDVIYVPESFF